MTIEELLRALERATGPQSGLDFEIAALAFPDDRLQRTVPRPYTASIDAALTLITEEWTAWKLRSRKGRAHYHAEVSRKDRLAGFEEISEGNSRYPAIALCIAALKARLIHSEGGD